jgi:hypothetical protein
MTYLESDAVISSCGQYRYMLRRTWNHAQPRVLIVMLNPSTADAKIDDATIRSCVRLCKWRNDGGFEVVNLFAYRATNPKELQSIADPVGPANDEIIEAALLRCDIAICAWGAYPGAIDRGNHIYSLLRQRRPAVFCWGVTKHGMPKHPLYIKSGTAIETYNI